jgi:hypothetical protein
MSAKAAAEALGVGYTSLVNLESLRASPVKKDGTWKNWCAELADKLFTPPEELWPEEALQVRASVKTLEMSGEQIFMMMGREPENVERLLIAGAAMGEVKRAMEEALDPRERAALLDWIESDTFAEVSEKIPKYADGTKRLTGEVGVTGMRAKQIVSKAIRKVRSHLRGRHLLTESSPFEGKVPAWGIYENETEKV